MAATLDPKSWSKWFVSGAPQVYSPEPLHSPNGFVLVPPVYDFPADIPFPTASSVPLPLSPSSKKLRKSVVVPASPPKLPPLSFTTDDSTLNPSPSESTHTSSSSRTSLLRKNPPTPQSPSFQRRLTKRRPSLPAIQSGSYAYLVEQQQQQQQQPPSVPPLPSSPTSLASAPAPSRYHSDPTHSSTAPSAPVQRASSLMTIRGFSLRSRKARALVEKDRSSPSRWGAAIWPGRSSASDSGHAFTSSHGMNKQNDWLPVMSITPFHVNLPPPSVSPPQLTLSALVPDTPPHSANQSTQHLPWGSESTGSIAAQPEPPPPPKRAKFTLTPDTPNRPPPTSYYDYSSPPSSMGHASHNCSPTRPPLVRRDARTWSSQRRWTLAMAMTDEGITDEVLVEELEKMRLRREWSGEDLDEGWDVWEAGGGWAGGQSTEEPGDSCEDSSRPWGEDSWIQDRGVAPHRTRRSSWKGDVYGGMHEDINETSPPTTSAFSSTPSLPHLPQPPPSYASPPPGPGRNPRSSTTPTATWIMARRALLICRELVRTERHYLTSLQALVTGDTTSVPPPLMLRYAGGLIDASVTLLKRMEEDPSAWGVAAAFLAAEEKVEGAFVAWCGAVGEWFEGGNGGSDDAGVPPKRKGSKVSVHAEEEGSPLRRTVSTWRRSFPSIPSLAMSVGATPLPPSAFMNRRKDKDKERDVPAAKRKPPVRDLAILPTQRVMRYVLLYRDLLAHTPATSPSHALVERAVDAACRIAQKCDRAQDNSAFLQRR